MLRTLLLLLGLMIGLSHCVRKSVFLARQQHYADTLRQLRQSLESLETNYEKCGRVVGLLRKQAESHQQQIAAYRDSLRFWQNREGQTDSMAWQRISRAYHALQAQNQHLLQRLAQLDTEKNDWFHLYQKGQLHQQLLEDSLKIQQTLLESAYASPYNYPRRLWLYENVFDCYVVNVARSQIRFFWRTADSKPYRNLAHLRRTLQRQNQVLLFATNAGMFQPDYAPQGLYVENGQMLRPLDRQKEGYGNFYMQPNGIFLLDSLQQAHIIPSAAFELYASRTHWATQSGPLLLQEGQINPQFTPGSANRFVRSGVGLISANQVVFVISQRPVNFYDFARLFRDQFGCREALYLDGVVSRMFLPEMGRYDQDGDFGPIIAIIK